MNANGVRSYETGLPQILWVSIGQLEVKAFHNGSPCGNPGDRTCHYAYMESPSLLWGSIGFHRGLRGNAA